MGVMWPALEGPYGETKGGNHLAGNHGGVAHCRPSGVLDGLAGSNGSGCASERGCPHPRGACLSYHPDSSDNRPIFSGNRPIYGPELLSDAVPSPPAGP